MASNIAKYATQASDVLHQVDKSAEAIKKQYEDLKSKHGKDIQSAMDSGKNFLSSIRSSFKKAPEAVPVSNENSIYPFDSYNSYNSPYNSKSIKRIIEQSPLSNPLLYQYSSLNPLLSQYPLSSSLSSPSPPYPLYEQSFYSSPYSLLDNEYSDIARFYPSSYNLSPVRRSPRRKSRKSSRRKSKRSQRK